MNTRLVYLGISSVVGGKPGEACIRDIKKGASDLLTD